MAKEKRLKKTPYSGNNDSREAATGSEEATETRGFKSLFDCWLKRSSRSNEIPLDLDGNEYDYIVEKLVVKRVPVCLFATAYDVYKRSEKEDGDSGDPALIVSDSQNVCPVAGPFDSSLFHTKTNGQTDFPAIPSNKTLRFTRNDYPFDTEASRATTSGYVDITKAQYRNAKLVDRLTALHPNLKESERAPKDPCPLNSARSRRSLAEELSEIAARTNESPNLHYERTRSERYATTGNSYTVQPGTSSEMSTPPVVAVPTRDKADQMPSRHKSSSCFPFGWWNETRHEEAEPVSSVPRTDGSLACTVDSSGPLKNRNFTVAPVQIHSPNLENIRRSIQDTKRREIFSHDCEDISSFGVAMKRENANSERLRKLIKTEEFKASDDSTIDNSAATTLRWKIIIKHRPPEDSAVPGTAKAKSQPKLSKELRGEIESRIRKASMSSRNHRFTRNKEKVPRRTF